MSRLYKGQQTRTLPVNLTLLEAEAILDLIEGHPECICVCATAPQQKKLQNIKNKIHTQAKILRENTRKDITYKNTQILERIST